MKKEVILKCLLILTLFSVSISIVIAAGGGGGGSSPNFCDEDIYGCTPWSSCKSDGTRSRVCTITTDCDNVISLKPSEKESCEYVSEIFASLKCHNQEPMLERVYCRLGLDDEELGRELKIAYLPEECRVVRNEGKRDECILLYSRSQSCWQKPIGDERKQCLKDLLGVNDILQQKLLCNEDDKCLDDLKKKVYSLIKFSFYDLEERAEDLYEEGLITREEAANIISNLEQKKVDFNLADSKEERKEVIVEIKIIWEKFINKLREK